MRSPAARMHVRWMFVFSSACGSRARCRIELRSSRRRSASSDESVPRENPLLSGTLIVGLSAGIGVGGSSSTRRQEVPERRTASSSATARENGLDASARTMGSARLTAEGTSGSSGRSYAISASSATSMSRRSTPPAAPSRLATSEIRSRSKPSRSIVSIPMRTFFSDVTSGLQTSRSWSVKSSAASIAASKRGPVSMTTAA